MSAKLEILHESVQNSDKQLVPHCEANLRAISVAALQAALGWWYVYDNIGRCPMLYLFEPFRLLSSRHTGTVSPKGRNRYSTGRCPVDMVPLIHDAACKAATHIAQGNALWFEDGTHRATTACMAATHIAQGNALWTMGNAYGTMGNNH